MRASRLLLALTLIGAACTSAPKEPRRATVVHPPYPAPVSESEGPWDRALVVRHPVDCLRPVEQHEPEVEYLFDVASQRAVAIRDGEQSEVFEGDAYSALRTELEEMVQQEQQGFGYGSQLESLEVLLYLGASIYARR